MAQAADNIQPSPELFFQTLTAYQRTGALKAAIELDVFTAIGEGVQTADAGREEPAAECEQKRQNVKHRMTFRCAYIVVATTGLGVPRVDSAAGNGAAAGP